MSSIQAGLKGNDTWRISATVNATVTRYNTSFDNFRDNQTFWQEISNTYFITAFEDFAQNFRIGYLPVALTQDDGHSCLLCHFRSDIYQVNFITNISSPDGVSFQSAARMHKTREMLRLMEHQQHFSISGQWELRRHAYQREYARKKLHAFPNRHLAGACSFSTRLCCGTQ